MSVGLTNQSIEEMLDDVDLIGFDYNIPIQATSLDTPVPSAATYSAQIRQSKTILSRVMTIVRSAKYVIGCVEKGQYRLASADNDTFCYEEMILSSAELAWYYNHLDPLNVLKEIDAEICQQPPYQLFPINELKESTQLGTHMMIFFSFVMFLTYALKFIAIKQRQEGEKLKLIELREKYAFLQAKADAERVHNRQSIMMAHAQKQSSSNTTARKPRTKSTNNIVAGKYKIY
jgi:hypothetical protein